MRKVLAGLLMAAAPVFGDSVVFDPPNPAPHRSVDAVVRVATAGCLATNVGIAVTGSLVTLRVRGALIVFEDCPRVLTFHLGTLPAGSYTVAAVLEDAGKTREIARATLIVRDDEGLTIRPYALPTTGGNVFIFGPGPFSSGIATIDGAVVPHVPITQPDPAPEFEAPPHAAGAVDVTSTSGGTTWSAKAGLIYYEPGSIDPAVFEPILFPLSFEGAGAFGSRWVTENVIDGYGAAYFRDPLPCGECANLYYVGKRVLANDNQPWGRVLYMLRGPNNLVFASRARDVSRQAQSSGVEIPVVRDRDFRTTDVLLTNVPFDPRARAMVRVWTRHDVGAIYVKVRTVTLTVPTTPIPGTDMAFASADITDALRTAGQNWTVLIQGADVKRPAPSIFAMVTVTNNETQEVTVVSSR